jgi:hypothetical protein
MKHRTIISIVLAIVYGCALAVGIYIASIFKADHFYAAIHTGMSEGQVDKQLPWASSKKMLDLKDTLWAKNFADGMPNGYVVQYWVWRLQPVEVTFTTNGTVAHTYPAYE